MVRRFVCDLEVWRDILCRIPSETRVLRSPEACRKQWLTNLDPAVHGAQWHRTLTAAIVPLNNFLTYSNTHLSIYVTGIESISHEHYTRWIMDPCCARMLCLLCSCRHIWHDLACMYLAFHGSCQPWSVRQEGRTGRSVSFGLSVQSLLPSTVIRRSTICWRHTKTMGAVTMCNGVPLLEWYSW